MNSGILNVDQLKLRRLGALARSLSTVLARFSYAIGGQPAPEWYRKAVEALLIDARAAIPDPEYFRHLDIGFGHEILSGLQNYTDCAAVLALIESACEFYAEERTPMGFHAVQADT